MYERNNYTTEIGRLTHESNLRLYSFFNIFEDCLEKCIHLMK